MRCLERIPVDARNGAHGPPYVLVGLIRQVGQGHAQRPLRSIEASAIEQHDAVGLRQPKRQVEGVDVLLQIFDRVVPDVFARPELEIDQAVIGVVIWVRLEGELEPLDGRPKPPVDDLLARGLVFLGRVHHLAQREEAHHHLLRQRESRRVVEGDVTAVRDDAVYEFKLARLEGQRAVALVERIDCIDWEIGNHLVEDVVLVHGDHAEPPSGCTEIL